MLGKQPEPASRLLIRPMSEWDGGVRCRDYSCPWLVHSLDVSIVPAKQSGKEKGGGGFTRT